MNLTKEELIEELKKEQEEIEAKAFKLYCKDELARQLDIIEDAEKDLENKKKRMDEMTIEFLRERFDRMDMSYQNSPRQHYIEQITGKKS
jgi:hypothetical protein